MPRPAPSPLFAERACRCSASARRWIKFRDDQWAQLIHLLKYRHADVVVDPDRAFSAPIFAHGGARIETVLSAFKSGTDITELTEEYGVPRADLLDVLRVYTEAA